MIYIYHLISIFAVLIVAPCFALFSLFSRHKWRRFSDHFGRVPMDSGPAGVRKTIWVHAVSLGEVAAVTPVLQHLRQIRPQDRMVLSVTTDSGYEAAKLKLPKLDALFFHPLDCLPCTWTAVNRVRPDLFVLVDTGFWPGFIHLLQTKGVRMLLFNGRVSSRSMRFYKMFKSFFSSTFSRFTFLCMQNPHGQSRLESLGVDESRFMVIGDPKYDVLPTPSPGKRERVRERMRITPGTLIWVAGSTHEGEEEMVLDVHRRLRKRYDNLVLILAPRRLERVQRITKIIMAKGLSFLRWSGQQDKKECDCTVLLLDTLGELSEVYSICDVAFVGRSLLAPGGGHNLIEPVAQGKPVLFGPYVENNRYTADELIENGLGTQVSNADNMEETIDQLLANGTKRSLLESKAREFILHHQGASRCMAELVDERIKD
ncbi:MAG: glycosyltransferase N-terminal domain-containing protein [Nitrospinaceae bacterium]|nr:glycosyltransferase N-terminal domain-containing protein [Nitrospinaceae bacterium]